MDKLRILWAECPGLVILGAALCVLTACFAVLAAYTMICPEGEENRDVYA